MDINSVKDFLGQDWTAVQGRIASALESDIAWLNCTNSSILSQSGKQLRPMLALMIARACAGKVEEGSVRYAAAAELLHNATLLHDDVADGSELRRGKPTIMSLMGCESYFWQGVGVNLLDQEARHNRRFNEREAYRLSDIIIRSNYFEQ